MCLRGSKKHRPRVSKGFLFLFFLYLTSLGLMYCSVALLNMFIIAFSCLSTLPQLGHRAILLLISVVFPHIQHFFVVSFGSILSTHGQSSSILRARRFHGRKHMALFLFLLLLYIPVFLVSSKYIQQLYLRAVATMNSASLFIMSWRRLSFFAPSFLSVSLSLFLFLFFVSFDCAMLLWF